MLKICIFLFLVINLLGVKLADDNYDVSVEISAAESDGYKSGDGSGGESAPRGIVESLPQRNARFKSERSPSKRASRRPSESSRSVDGCTSVSTIATFNIQNLSPNKLAKSDVGITLKKIISRYDVILVQEIQDRSQTVCDLLRDQLNEDNDEEERYDYVLSSLTGRTTGEKEQYAMFYRPSVVKVLDSELYPDPEEYYSRKPHLVEMRYVKGDLPNLTLVNIHAKPDATSTKKTVSEISHLADVYEYIKRYRNTQNVMFMGDMNADGRYVTSRDWSHVASRTDPSYVWLIDDDVDTTVGKSDNAYDRIIVTGHELLTAVVAESASVYRFDDADNCCPMTQKQALKVSDHYPVEVKLKISTCH